MTRFKLTLGLYAALMLVCFSNTVFAVSDLPLLGEQSSLNLQREYEIGERLYKTLDENGYVIDEPLLARYLSDIGESLLATLDQRVRDYRFYLVKDGSINAFAAPGGYIGVNLGLIAVVRTEDELAAVLAHEIAHVELMHGMQMLEKARDASLAGMVSILAGILVSSQDSQLGGALIYSGAAGSAQAMVNFTRTNEYEADRVGIELLKRSDYDARRMADFMLLLQSREGPGSLSNIEYIRTHPLGANRVAEIQSRLQDAEAPPPRSRRFEQFRDYLAYKYPGNFSLTSGSRFAQALELARNGRYVEAEVALRELVRSDEDSIWYRYTLAENMRDQKRDKEAQQIYQSLLLLYPDDFAIGVRLAEVLRAQGLNGDALGVLRNLAKVHDSEPRLYKMLVGLYEKLGEGEKRSLAEADYHWFNGNRELAKKLYKKMLAEGSLDPGAREKIGQRLEESGK